MVFVVDDGKHRLGIMTDLGHVFNGLADVIASLDAVLPIGKQAKHPGEYLLMCLHIDQTTSTENRGVIRRFLS